MNPRRVVILVAALAVSGLADEEASNTLYVVANGGWYAKSVPSGLYGTEGKTLVYLAGKEQDSLQYTYDWYSPRPVHLKQWAWGVSVVRFGPWHRGAVAKAEDLALALYNGNKLLATYSTLDLAGNPGSVCCSVSHYTVIRRVLGYRWIRANDYVFEVELHSGRVLAFDLGTGRLRTDVERPTPSKQEAGVQHRQVKVLDDGTFILTGDLMVPDPGAGRRPAEDKEPEGKAEPAPRKAPEKAPAPR